MQSVASFISFLPNTVHSFIMQSILHSAAFYLTFHSALTLRSAAFYLSFHLSLCSLLYDNPSCALQPFTWQSILRSAAFYLAIHLALCTFTWQSILRSALLPGNPSCALHFYLAIHLTLCTFTLQSIFYLTVHLALRSTWPNNPFCDLHFYLPIHLAPCSLIPENPSCDLKLSTLQSTLQSTTYYLALIYCTIKLFCTLQPITSIHIANISFCVLLPTIRDVFRLLTSTSLYTKHVSLRTSHAFLYSYCIALHCEEVTVNSEWPESHDLCSRGPWTKKIYFSF
jgi:hypothetical protein